MGTASGSLKAQRRIYYVNNSQNLRISQLSISNSDFNSTPLFLFIGNNSRNRCCGFLLFLIGSWVSFLIKRIKKERQILSELKVSTVFKVCGGNKLKMPTQGDLPISSPLWLCLLWNVCKWAQEISTAFECSATQRWYYSSTGRSDDHDHFSTPSSYSIKSPALWVSSPSSSGGSVGGRVIRRWIWRWRWRNCRSSIENLNSNLWKKHHPSSRILCHFLNSNGQS